MGRLAGAAPPHARRERPKAAMIRMALASVAVWRRVWDAAVPPAIRRMADKVFLNAENA